MVNVALDSSSINIRDSRFLLKNWYYRLRPTRNIAKKCRSISTVDGINLGLFCNGTMGLNILKLSKKHCIDIFGVYLSRKFIVDLFFEDIKFVQIAQDKTIRIANVLKERFKKAICRNGLKKTIEDVKNKKFVCKLIKTKEFISDKVIISKQIKEALDDVLHGNISDVLIENRIKKILKNDIKKDGKMIMRLDDPWIYFSAYDMLKNNFILSVDYSPEKYLCLCEYFRKMNNLNKICSVNVSFDTTKIMSHELNIQTNIFFNKLEKDNPELVCNVLVMNYLTGIERENREIIFRRFSSHIKQKKVADPLLIVKFSRSKYYEAEVMFELFLSELSEIFNKN